MSLRNFTPAARSRATSAGRSSTMRWMRFQPPALGRSPSALGGPAELVAPLSRRRSEPRATSAKAGACLDRTVKPRCVVYHATAASTSSTMYRTLTVSAGMPSPSVAAVVRGKIGRDRAGLVRRRMPEPLEHVGDHARPVALATLRRGDTLEIVTERAARLDQLLAGARRKRHGLGLWQRLARTEMSVEILQHGVDVARSELRAADHHVVDVALPAVGAVAHCGERREPMALRAGRGDDVAALALRQRRCVLRAGGRCG